MVVFPIIAFVVSAACAAVIGLDAYRRPRPDRIVWTIAFVIFAVAAGAEALGSLWEWSEPLARVYYLTGAVLVVGYLALGEGYLLARDRIAKVAPGLTLLMTALAATLVINAPIDEALLAEEGWEAIERGPALVAMTVAINTLGTLVLAGGALYSAWRFRKLGIQRNRMIGCVLIAAGTLVVASGGTLTRFGQREYLYIAMSVGVAIIFAGVLQTRRPDAALAREAALPTESGRQERTPRLIALREANPGQGRAALDQGIAYIETRLLPLGADAIDRACAVWSVPQLELEVFDRAQARRVWELRTRLSPAAQDAFDALPPPIRLQLAELYAEVFAAPAGVARSG
jgi:hypothetical protein